MQRLRLGDIRASRGPRVWGLCQDNLPGIAQIVNAAQQNLLYDKAASDESWNGTWASVRFQMTRAQPFITLPREIARLEAVTVCNEVVPLQNQFYEMLEFGNGKMSTDRCNCPDQVAVYARNNAVAFADLVPGAMVRAYITNSQDVGKRVLVSGTDTNDMVLYSQNGTVRAQGVFLTLDSVPVTTDVALNTLTGLQKDACAGPVQIFQVDPTTGNESLLVTMQPSELTAWYRRYFVSNLPCSCCPGTDCTTGTVQVDAIAKLDLVPVSADSDPTLLQCSEAIIAEGQAIRLQEADTMAAQNMAMIHHQRAVRLLISELGHFQGVNVPAVGFAPFANDWANPIGPRTGNGAWNTWSLNMV